MTTINFRSKFMVRWEKSVGAAAAVKSGPYVAVTEGH